MLLEDVVGRKDAVRVADRIIEALSLPITINGQEVYASASIGIAFDGEDVTSDQILRNADLAMYTAKGRGKGRYEVYKPAMHAAAIERLELEGDLRRAIVRGELVVHYQPMIELSTGRMKGIEALVRWQHPVRGLLSPPPSSRSRRRVA